MSDTNLQGAHGASDTDTQVDADNAEPSEGASHRKSTVENDNPGGARRNDTDESTQNSGTDQEAAAESGSAGSETRDASPPDSQGDSTDAQNPITPASDDDALQKLLKRYQDTTAPPLDDKPQDRNREPDGNGQTNDDGDARRDEATTDAPDDQKPFDDSSTGIDQKVKPDRDHATSEQDQLSPATDPDSSATNDSGPELDSGDSPSPKSGDAPATEPAD